MRCLINSILIITLLQWQLNDVIAANNTSDDLSVQNTSGTNEIVVDELTMLAHATYGAKHLECVEHGKSKRDAYSYPMFQAACQILLAKKINSAAESKTGLHEAEAILAGKPGQHESIAAATGLTLTAANLMGQNKEIMADAAINLEAVLAKVKEEDSDKTQKVSIAEQEYDAALSSLMMAAMSALIMQYMASAAAISCQGACTGCTGPIGLWCSVQSANTYAWYIGIVAAYVLAWQHTKQRNKNAKKNGVGEGKTVEIKMSSVEGAKELLDKEEYVLTNLEVLIKGIPDFSSMGKKSSNSLEEFFSISKGNLLSGVDSVISSSITDANAYCPSIMTCPGFASWFGIQAVLWIMAVMYMIWCIIDLYKKSKALVHAYYHTNLICEEKGSVADTLNSIVPRLALSIPGLPAEIDRIKSAKSDEEAYHHIVNVKKMMSGEVYNVGQSAPERAFFKEAKSRSVSFKDRGTTIVSNFIKLMVKNSYADETQNLGLKSGTGNFAYYKSQLKEAGPIQLEGWPRPKDRVAYMSALVTQSIKAAGGAGSAAMATAIDANNYKELLNAADVNMQVNKGNVEEIRPIEGISPVDENGNKITGSDFTNCVNCTNVSGGYTIGGVPGAVVLSNTGSYLVQAGKAIENGDLTDYERLQIKLRKGKNAIREISKEFDKKLSPKNRKEARKRAVKFENKFRSAHNKSMKAATGKMGRWAMLQEPTDTTDNVPEEVPENVDSDLDFGDISFDGGGEYDMDDGSERGKYQNEEKADDLDSLEDKKDAWKSGSDGMRVKDGALYEIGDRGGHIFQAISRRYERTAFPVFNILIKKTSQD